MANMKMLEDARQCLLERGCSDGAGLLATGTKKIHGRAEIQTSVLLTAERDIVDIILPNPCNLADILHFAILTLTTYVRI